MYILIFTVPSTSLISFHGTILQIKNLKLGDTS